MDEIGKIGSTHVDCGSHLKVELSSEGMQRSLRRIIPHLKSNVSTAPPRARFNIQNEPKCIYAVGDIHGCLDQLLALKRAIQLDAETIQGLKLIVYLGDYIDRGPYSASIIEHLMMPAPKSFRQIWLCGNHEASMIDYLDGRLAIDNWLQMGGAPTLLSYGYDIRHRRARGRIGKAALLRDIRNAIPLHHQTFLRKIPVSFSTPSRLFVHAGIRPGIPFDMQSDYDLMWIREPFLSQPSQGFDRLVVHGHTPSPRPTVTSWRVGVDTCAYSGEPLTAVRLTHDAMVFLRSH